MTSTCGPDTGSMAVEVDEGGCVWGKGPWGGRRGSKFTSEVRPSS